MLDIDYIHIKNEWKDEAKYVNKEESLYNRSDSLILKLNNFL